MAVFGVPMRYILYAGVLITLAAGVTVWWVKFRDPDDQMEPSTNAQSIPIDRETVQTVLVVTPIIAVFAFALWRGYQTMATFFFILFTAAFVLGLLLVPLLAWTGLGASLSTIAEKLAAGIFYLTMIGIGRGALVQRETDEFEIQRVKGDLGPASYWSRWAGAKFGITFEATREAFEPTIVDDEYAAELEHLEYGDDKIATVDLDRGPPGTTWFAKESDQEADILVPIGQKLAELRDAAGPRMGMEAYAEALKDYGGNTASYTNRMMIVGTFVFTALGIGMGWIIFF